MKVLFTFGGIPHYLNALLEKLQSKGIDVVVVTPQKGNAIIGKGVKMVSEGSYKRITSQEKKMFYGKAAYPELPSIIRKEKPNILVVGWPYFMQLRFQPQLRKALKECSTKVLLREIPFQTPPFGHIREYFRANPMYDENMHLLSCGNLFYLRQWFIANIRKYCYSIVSGTLNYSTVAYDILPSYGVAKEKIHVTYNSTDTDALCKVKSSIQTAAPILPSSSRRILHIGRLVKWKRVDLLIDAFTKVHQQYSDSELIIVGDGPELNNLKQQAEKSGLSSSVRFAGSIYKPEELGAYMSESTIYVLAGMEDYPSTMP
jgi:glycosyltransferase involved in cell wall biosynthesis